jgi:hypothetical protein
VPTPSEWRKVTAALLVYPPRNLSLSFSESHALFPGFALVCLHEILVCLEHHVAKQAGIGRHDRHHSINDLLWITLKVLLSQKVEKFLDIGPLYEVSRVVLPVKGGLGQRLVETSQEGPGLMVCT